MATNNCVNTTMPATGGYARDIANLASATDGQIVMGSTGVAPVLGSITAGAGISVTPGAGSLSIAATSLPITLVNGAVPMVTNNGYRVAFNTTATFTLPATSAVGDIIAVYLENDGLFGTNNPVLSVAQAAGQQIFLSGTPSTAGITGGIASTTSFGGAVVFRCVIADTEWFVESLNGIASTAVY